MLFELDVRVAPAEGLQGVGYGRVIRVLGEPNPQLAF